MANAEHLEVLRQGVDIWNQWRRDNPDLKIDLRNANLRNASFSNVNLSETILFDVDLHGADLRKANLGAAKLNNAKLSEAKLEGANLGDSVLSGADLNNANLISTKLFYARLFQASLQGAKLESAKLTNANLFETNFKYAILNKANLNDTNLTGADLSEADLWLAKFDRASLVGTNLSESFLYEASFVKSDLTKANLLGADLRFADFSEANLTDANFFQADFTNTILGYTILANNDLREIVGLELVDHFGPSMVGIDTIRLSNGNIPTEFLVGCGLRDWEIESARLYQPGLSNQEIDEILYKIHDLRATQPIQISPLFISYSHTDIAFVNKIEENFNAKGIRFWRDVHHATAGRLEKQIDRAIRHNPTVLVILSENSIKSDWVEHEVRTARELQKELGRDTLCPVALDDSWKDSPWAKRGMEQVKEYNILDFSEWKKDSEFEKLFKKLIDGLELFYK